MSFGEFTVTGEVDPTPIGTIEPSDYYLAYSLGAGIDYGVQFNAGITYKDITSDLGRAEANTDVIDFGFLLNVPVIKLVDDSFSFNIIESVPAIPFFNISFGY